MKRIILLVMSFAVSICLLVGCGDDTSYCKVSGCPSETDYGHKYCYRHKCFNYSCENQSYINGYCEECLERADK